MKKFRLFAAMCVLVLALGAMTACGGNNTQSTEASTQTSAPETTAPDTTAPETTADTAADTAAPETAADTTAE